MSNHVRPLSKIALPATLVAATLLVAACGSSGGERSASNPATRSGAAVSLASVGSLGDVLVDRKGMTLYTPDLEARGTIACTGPCTAFWRPVVAGAGAPTSKGDVGKLGVVKRPDGTRQITAKGRPLYTFSEDTAAGQAKGDGFTDDFGGKRFVWHAVAAGGMPATTGGS